MSVWPSAASPAARSSASSVRLRDRVGGAHLAVEIFAAHRASSTSISVLRELPDGCSASRARSRRRARCRRVRAASGEMPRACAASVASAPPSRSASGARGPPPQAPPAPRGERLSYPLSSDRKLAAELLSQPFGQPIAAARASTLVGEDVARGAVEPETRLLVERNLGEPPPGNQEGLGNDIGRVIGIEARRSA